VKDCGYNVAIGKDSTMTSPLLEKFRGTQPVSDESPQKVIAGWEQLRWLNEKAKKQHFNGQLELDVLQEIIQKDLLSLNEETAIGNIENVIFPVTFSMVHNDTEIRVVFGWGNEEHHPHLDVSFDDYEALLDGTSFEGS
jgi:hypothetical protein